MVRAPFKEQIVFGLDVCEKVIFRAEHYQRLLQTLGRSEQAKILRSTFVGQMFEKDPKFTHFVWDVLVSAAIIEPGIITAERTHNIDINTQYGLSYGQSLAYPKFSPPGTRPVRIVTSINEARFWDMVNDKTFWASVQ